MTILIITKILMPEIYEDLLKLQCHIYLYLVIYNKYMQWQFKKVLINANINHMHETFLIIVIEFI